jgi:tRNA(Ile)-lysidine synthase
MGPHPAVAAIRLAVRPVLHDVINDHAHDATHATHDTRPADPPLVLAACSGGADSMALASALAFEAAKLAVPAGARTN